ncbi:MAG: DUF4349 domain-containing protein [Candidatus Gracilibacteria bacterium]|nr:DUF4349 domain-containing protein [Candidatus Gracilibacteria bacterium]
MKTFLSRFWTWAQRNPIALVATLALVIWLWPDSSPVTYRAVQQEKMQYAMGAGADFAESNTVKGRSGKMMPTSIIPPAYADFEPQAEERKIVKNASLGLQVEDTEEARTEVESLVEAFDAFVTNLNSHEVRPGILAYNLTIRVPADKLEPLMNAVINLGMKKHENFSIQDITAQYVDLESRLENLETRRERLREMMDRETDNLSDVLQIDRELTSVQQEIENIERQLKRHDTDVDFSTLTLSIQPEPQIGDFSSPDWTVKRTWRQSVNDLIVSLQDIFTGAIKVFVFAPIWIPVLAILWGLQRWRRRALRNRQK